jgi:putative DNA-invertase from lambdoid prophage Rac
LGQRVALYCRVSTADQSCARQERELAAFAERSGYDIVGIFKETSPDVQLDRAERRKVMSLPQARQVDAVLVTELSRWGCSTTDLLATLKELEARRVSMIATERHGIRSLHAAWMDDCDRAGRHRRARARTDPGTHPLGNCCCKARGKRLGRQFGQRPKSDRAASKVLPLIEQGRSYRLISREVGLNKNTVAEVAKRSRSLQPAVAGSP